jgi:hypothetical protein
MQPDATLAVYHFVRKRYPRREEKTYHAITQAINDFIKEAGDEWFAG